MLLEDAHDLECQCRGGAHIDVDVALRPLATGLLVVAAADLERQMRQQTRQAADEAMQMSGVKVETGCEWRSVAEEE